MAHQAVLLQMVVLVHMLPALLHQVDTSGKYSPVAELVRRIFGPRVDTSVNIRSKH